MKIAILKHVSWHVCAHVYVDICLEMKFLGNRGCIHSVYQVRPDSCPEQPKESTL